MILHLEIPGDYLKMQSSASVRQTMILHGETAGLESSWFSIFDTVFASSPHL